MVEWCHMCGRFTLEPTASFYERFEITNRLDAITARYNIAPGQRVPVVIAHSPNQVVLMRWGLIPHWAKDEKSSYKMINARIETLTQKPSYRGLLARNRCLVPASGYYEWKAEERGNTKIPYYIHPSSGSFVAFAGLFDSWTNPKGEELQTFTIVTKDADEEMARLHNRMPVVLAREDEQAWLDPDITAPTQAVEILARSAGAPLDTYPVSRMVNKPSVDGKELIQPVA
jgi:putative SOS response-associated peptidase YedK